MFFNESGSEFKISSFKEKLTLFEFWTTSCANCPESLQEFHELAKQYNTNTKIDFITVNINLGKRQDTIYKKELESTILLPKLNTDEIIFKQLNFNTAPVVLVLDQNSNIVYLGFPNFRKYSKNYLPEIVKKELNKM